MQPFSAVDEDGDGLVDKEEFMLAVRNSLEAAGHQVEKRRKVYAYLDRLYDFCDLDGDGFLSAPEYKYSHYMTTGFGGGSILRSDPAAVDQALADLKGAEDSILEAFDEMDSDGDGSLDWSEFILAARSELQDWGWLEEEFLTPRMHDALAAIFQEADVVPERRLSPKEVQYAGYLLFDFATQAVVRFIEDEYGEGPGLRIRRDVVEARAAEEPPRPGGRPSLGEVVLGHFDTVDADGSGVLDDAECVLLARLLLQGEGPLAE